MQRISKSIRVGIQSAHEADRIAFEIPSEGRHIVAESVLVPAGFSIEILTGQAEILSDRASDGTRLAEGLVGSRPDDSLGTVRCQLRRPEPVTMNIIEAARAR